MKATFFLAATFGAATALAGNWSVTAVTGTGTGTGTGYLLPTANATYIAPTAATSTAVSTSTSAVTAGAPALGAQAIFGAVAAVAAAVLTL